MALVLLIGCGLPVPLFGRMLFGFTADADQANNKAKKSYTGSSVHPSHSIGSDTIDTNGSMVDWIDTESYSNLMVVVGSSEVTQESISKDDGRAHCILRVVVLIDSYQAFHSVSWVSNSVALGGDLVLMLAEEEVEGQEVSLELTAFPRD